MAAPRKGLVESVAEELPNLRQHLETLQQQGDQSARTPESPPDPPVSKLTSLQADAAQPIAYTVASFRLRSDLIPALDRASFARKQARRAPWKKQDIVNEALRQWLERNGHDG